MANTELIKTYVGKVDLRGKVGYAVVGTTDAKVNYTSVVTLGALNGKGVGIIVDDGLGAGEAITVCVNGFAQAQAGATAIPAFSPLKIDANGALIPATTTTDVVVAFANEAIPANTIGEVKVVEPRAFI